MLDLKFLMDEFKLDGFDLSKLNIPKNIIYLIIAFKLINNLDKIIPQKASPIPNFKNMCPIRMKPNNNNSFMSLFVVFLVIGGIMVLANNLLDRINISLMSCGVNSLKGSNLNFPRSTIMKKVFYENKKENEECLMKKCPLMNMDECPMKKCPLINKPSVGTCPLRNIANIKCCPFFSNEVEEKLQDIIDSENISENIEEAN